MNFLTETNVSNADMIALNIEEFCADLLLSLKYCFGDPEKAHFFIFYAKELFAARLSHLVETRKASPKMLGAVSSLLDEIVENAKTEKSKVLDNVVKNFEDKKLAKEFVTLYTRKFLEGNKYSFTEFIKQSIEDMRSKQELEQELGVVLDEKRLSKFLLDPNCVKLTFTNK